MRLFCTLILVGSGCAFDAVEGPSPDDVTENDDDVTPEPVAPLIADLCDQRSWEIQPDTKQLDISVVATAAGATVFTVPKEGGAVRGFRVDHRGDLVDREIATVRDDQSYTSVNASIAAGRVVVASTAGERVTMDIVRDDLGAQFRLGELEGSLVSDAPMLTSRATQFALVGGAAGVTANGFVGSDWATTGEPIQLTKSPVVSMTGAARGRDAFLAWSGADRTCHWAQMSSGRHSYRDFGCDDVRMAINPEAVREHSMLVYAEDGSVYRTNLESDLTIKQTIAAHGTSPRVVFDGTYYWTSYLNIHGDVVVGFVDDNGTLHSRALEGTRPDHAEAYDLAVFGGGVWIVGVDGNGFGAQRICARPRQ
jgi:hypothetical protein